MHDLYLLAYMYFQLFFRIHAYVVIDSVETHLETLGPDIRTNSN